MKTFIESVNAVQEDVKIVFKQDGLFRMSLTHLMFALLVLKSLREVDSYEVNENVVIPLRLHN